MSPVRGEDLPKAVRDKLGITGKGQSSKKSRAGIRHSVDCSGSCSCGEAFARYSDFEKHSKATGHARWRIDLP